MCTVQFYLVNNDMNTTKHRVCIKMNDDYEGCQTATANSSGKSK